MITPAGKECRYYFEDYFRGRDVKECRLVKANPDSARWNPSDCAKCPVPAILAANASLDMELKLTIRPTLLGFRRMFEVTAFCIKHRIPIADPYLGCEKCNAERPGLDLFMKALGEDSESSEA